jgi:hypothetical protein
MHRTPRASVFVLTRCGPRPRAPHPGRSAQCRSGGRTHYGTGYVARRRDRPYRGIPERPALRSRRLSRHRGSSRERSGRDPIRPPGPPAGEERNPRRRVRQRSKGERVGHGIDRIDAAGLGFFRGVSRRVQRHERSAALRAAISPRTGPRAPKASSAGPTPAPRRGTPSRSCGARSPRTRASRSPTTISSPIATSSIWRTRRKPSRDAS